MAIVNDNSERQAIRMVSASGDHNHLRKLRCSAVFNCSAGGGTVGGGRSNTHDAIGGEEAASEVLLNWQRGQKQGEKLVRKNAKSRSAHTAGLKTDAASEVCSAADNVEDIWRGSGGSSSFWNCWLLLPAREAECPCLR